MFNKLWERTKEVASMYTGTFIAVMLLNQLLFFGFCLNPVCLIAAMPHVLFITVIIGTWLNRQEAKRKKDLITKDELSKTFERKSGTSKVTQHSVDLTEKIDKRNKVASPELSTKNTAINLKGNKQSVRKNVTPLSDKAKNLRGLSNSNAKNKSFKQPVKQVAKRSSSPTKNITAQAESSYLDNPNTQINDASLSVRSDETRESLKNKHKKNIQLRFREKIQKDKSTVTCFPESRFASIGISLTSDKYLNDAQIKARASLRLTDSSAKILLDHDINNQYDPLAMRVMYNNIYIGHVEKGGNDKEIDIFCFEHGHLKSDIVILWTHGGLQLQKKQTENNLSISGFLNKHCLESLWHMTHIDNLEGILKNGILSHSLAHKQFNPVDISDHSVQHYRSNPEPIYNRKIHEYAPTYISIKNPMLYARKNISPQICLIEISSQVMVEMQSLFTDGNAASRDTLFFRALDDLSKLPWDVLRAGYWNDFADGKRKKCAEVLIYPKIDAKFIKAIHCSSYESKQVIEKSASSGIPMRVTPSLFF